MLFLPNVKKRTYSSIALLLWLVSLVNAAVPPTLPGQEITGEAASHVNFDTAQLKTPSASPYSPEWFSDAVSTWDAPTITQQLDEDPSVIPLGKGAVFIPRISEASLEPDVQISDSTGKIVATGKPGKKFGLVPGTYSVMLGNGSIRQRITKWVTIDEGKVTPLYPTWAGLAVDVVNESNISFRGSYEMARLDEFEPFGRTYGRDPNLGERVKTWILKPGVYKIFGVGQSYNTVNNYVTVRLLPGEFVRFNLVQDSTTQKIMGGGVSTTGGISRKISSDWRYGLDLGGSVLFNTSNDTNNSAIVLLSNLRINHTKGKGNWDTKIFFDEELNFSDINISQLNFTSDDFRVYSLYIWRFSPRFGPYGRMQFETNFFPVYDRFDPSSQRHAFLVLQPDSTIEKVDTTSTSVQTQPSFSPLSIELGVGSNFDAISLPNFDMKLKLGFGYSQRRSWDQLQNAIKDTAGIKTREDFFIPYFDSTQLHSLFKNYVGAIKVIQHQKAATVVSYGPETSIDGTLRLGRYGTAEGELIVRFPIEPIIIEHSLRPDYKLNTILSWRITSAVTLDYLYQYQFSQPLKTDLKVDLSQHRVWLRYSFNTAR